MKSTIAILALAISAGCFAQSKTAATKAAPKTIHCAVMPQDEISVAEATKAKRFADYKGKRYFFCCPSCVVGFKKDPSKYATAESIDIPKATKSAKKKSKKA